MTENRYQRQQILKGVGTVGQQKLAAAHVLVVGAGGLGAPALLYLAGAGIGSITIADHDFVSLSNLHRQIIYTMADLGTAKAVAARQRALALNPDISIEIFTDKVGPGNIAALVSGMNVVIDAADSLALTYMLSAACMDAGVPLISASALEQSGYIGGFCGGGPGYRAVFPDMPDQIGSCDVNGVLGPVVGVLGSLQAQWTIQVLLGHQPSPIGQLYQIDLAHMRSTMFRFDTAAEPAYADLPFISINAVTNDDFIVELRPATEAPDPVHPAAYRILPDQIADAQVPDDRRIVLCCRSGVRAHRAGRILQQRGITQLALMIAQNS